MGKQPKQVNAFSKHLNFVLGYSVHKLTEGYTSRKPEPRTEYNVGRVRRLEFHSRRCELCTDREPRHKKSIGQSKARNDVLAMVDRMVKDFQGKPDDTCENLCCLKKLRIFKLAIEKDEPAFSFDVMNLNLRCIRLLQEI